MIWLLERPVFSPAEERLSRSAAARCKSSWRRNCSVFTISSAASPATAIASGMADGMGFGDNTRAALITRGLAEMSRLGVAMGGHASTFAGLAGMGDLIATCSSRQSRNNSVGIELGRGRAIADILADMKMVAEGVASSVAVLNLAARYGVEMPICEQVVAVCHRGATAVEVLDALMGRDSKSEVSGQEWS